jgi:dolichol-phosphate mannosyltransferase
MIAVSIPCYRVKKQILSVIEEIPREVGKIYVVDDACPEHSGAWVNEKCKDPRVKVIVLDKNLGVGGATMAGFVAALADGANIVVKLDGDGQMSPSEIPRLIRPIQQGHADYTKGNRFYSLSHLGSMPRIRLLGNSILSFVSKMASGYYRTMDPTNGFIAIHTQVLSLLSTESIAKRYFFESDMLYQLNIVRAVITDVPMAARYGDEKSSLRISRVAVSFPLQYLWCFSKRIFYNYFLRDFNIGSAQLIAGLVLFLAGAVFGTNQWLTNSSMGIATPTGTIMLAILPMIVGFQLLLSALNYDILNEPRVTLHKLLES